MGVIQECLGNTQRAVEYYQKCGDYTLAEKRLKEILSKNQ